MIKATKSLQLSRIRGHKLYSLLSAAIIICFLYYLWWIVEYHGTVKDANTQEPIEGAIIVAKWIQTQPLGIAGGISKWAKVKETLTDRDGRWSIRGPRGAWGRLLIVASYLERPEFIVWKPGYCSCPDSLAIDACKKMTPVCHGEGETVELPRLTNTQDRRRALPGRIGTPHLSRKQKTFVRLINQERRNLGMSVYKLYVED